MKKNQIWETLGLFFAVTIVVGVLSMVYIADKYGYGPFFDSKLVKYISISYCSIGVFFIVFSEVKKRSNNDNPLTQIVYTLITMAVIFTILALTRL